MKRATHRKRALVIITDTVDNREQIPLSALKDRINQQEILIYTVGLFQGGRAQLLGKGAYPAPGMAGPAPSIWESLFGPSALSKNMLETFATESGGRSIALNIYNLTSEESVTSMTLFVYSLSADLRGQYTIGYYAPESGSAGNRVIRIRTASPDFLVQTRRGAPASEPSHRKNSD
jgi:hypothetical protein